MFLSLFMEMTSAGAEQTGLASKLRLRHHHRRLPPSFLPSFREMQKLEGGEKAERWLCH